MTYTLMLGKCTLAHNEGKLRKPTLHMRFAEYLISCHDSYSESASLVLMSSIAGSNMQYLVLFVDLFEALDSTASRIPIWM